LPDSPADAESSLATFNPDLARQFDRVARVSRSRVAVLVQGETGTGKELVAKAIHQLSGREGPFVVVNCGALPRSLLESELFGYRKGAFSGASQDRAGFVRAADGGTLFLDEIGDLPVDGQAVLLRVLQEGEVQPIGTSHPVRVDVRIVAATHRDLARMVEGGRFREDLLARLNGFSVTLPPLRERREDMGGLIEHLVRRHDPERASTIVFAPEVVRAFHGYRWPQNIRELEKAIASALLLAREDILDLDSFPAAIRDGDSTVTPASLVRDAEPGALRIALEKLLEKHRGNVTAAATAMGTSRMQIHRLCRRFGIDLRQYRSGPL
jgi:transcriptional regulator with GAF, ATPase, and Fis domain